MAPLIWSVLDRILLASVLAGLVIMGRQLAEVQKGAESREAMMAQQIETLARHMANAETRDTAAADRDKVLAQQISAVVQQHTGQLDNIGAELTECVNKTAEH